MFSSNWLCFGYVTFSYFSYGFINLIFLLKYFFQKQGSVEIHDYRLSGTNPSQDKNFVIGCMYYSVNVETRYGLRIINNYNYGVIKITILIRMLVELI